MQSLYKRALPISLVLSALSATGFAAPADFNADVWPILAERCIRCHGTEKQEGELRLDTPDAIKTGGEYGVVVEAGKPDASTLIELISLPADDADVMPSKGDTLSSGEIAVLTQWIEEGASFDGWSQSLADKANAAAKAFWAKKKDQPVVLPAAFKSDIQKIEFNRDIRPILSDNCFKCHGQDKAARKADLRLDIEELATAEHDGERAVYAGKPRKSELVKHIFHSDPDEMMPPAKSDKSLTESEKHLLAAWIEQGADFETHWAYTDLERPHVASAKNDTWSENPIDAFIADRLKQEGLSPSQKADPVTLVRRVYHDLTGLPPTPEVVDAFAADPSGAAYSKLLDTLLASVSYGERMAINWLDQVRYADSNGYHSDEERVVYPYRDYVIKAFNENKPFDEFTIEQLAGDLLENPTTEQLVATGFNRLNQITAEGGAQSKEYRVKYNADRVRALGSVWMGATLGCAECHEHKFDPYEPHDFYRFAAFFADVEEDDVYAGDPFWTPILRLPNDEQKEKLGVLEQEIQRLDIVANVSDRNTRKNALAWESKLNPKESSLQKGWLPLSPDVMRTENGGAFEVQHDLSILSVGLDSPQDVHTFTFTTDQEMLTGLRFDASSHPSFEHSLSRHRNQTKLNECEIFVKTPDMTEPQQVEIRTGAIGMSKERGPLMRTIDGDLMTDWSRNGGKEEDRRKPFSWLYEFKDPIPGGSNTEITVKLHYLGIAGNDRSAFGRLRVSATTDKRPKMTETVGVPERLVSSLINDRRLSSKDKQRMVNYYASIDESRDESRKALDKAYADKRTLEKGMAYTLYTKAIAVPRDIRFLPRGNWQDDSGPIVEPGVPAFLPSLEYEGERPTRLDLARWIVDEKNPLTARVFVNRLWKLYFGKGISAVLDDLGSQGEPPVHPELLDWLAVEFMDSGWDVKHIVRLILKSSAYQQSSVASPELMERDPQNRLIARQSTFRYEAEMVRDTALKVSGLLNPKVGGASVRPYQPEGYWQHLNFPKRVYKHHADDRQYRRGLYIHWQRSFLHPSMKAFDAPSREECVAERNLSNTPLQALTLLNDPSYVEAADAFAKRIIAEGGDSISTKAQWALRQGILRKPTPDETQILEEIYTKHVAQGGDNPELAAWTSVARIVLNLHETITRS